MPSDKLLHGRNGGQQPAFTLIEVLVVVAIIALLISILLPSLAAARGQARNSVCLNNLAQIGKAAVVYAHDHKGYLPHSGYNNAISVLNPKAARELDKALMHHNEVFFCPDNTGTPMQGKTKNDFQAQLTSYIATSDSKGVPIGYWWVADPAPAPPPPVPADSDPRAKYIDSDKDGRTEDEYLIRLEQRDAYRIVIATDVSGQEGGTWGWYFNHGRQQMTGTMTNVEVPPDRQKLAGIIHAWKNNLYGDAHAERVLGAKVRPRWGENIGKRAGW